MASNEKIKAAVRAVKQRLEDFILDLPEPELWMYIPAVLMSVAAVIVSLWEARG